MHNYLNKDVELFQIDGISILGNFQNGAVIGLDEEGKDYILNNQMVDETKVISSNIAELREALLELDFYQHKTEKEIDAAYLHVTDRCNLHCLGCYSFVDSRNEKKDLSTNDFFYILLSLREAGIKKLVISGGEPFLRRDLGEILRYGKEVCNIQYITVITNGTLDFSLYESSIPYMDEINVSVDGFNKDTEFIRDKGIMPKVIETIKKLKVRLTVNLIVTLHKKNKDYMEDYRAFAAYLGVNYSFSIFTAEPENEMFRDYVLTDEDLFSIEKKLMDLNGEVSLQDFPVDGFNLVCRKKCEAGNKLISIAADGTVYPCHMLHKEQFALGNVLRQSISDIVFREGNPFQHLSVDKMKGCRNCNYKYLCGGGCRGRSYLYYSVLDEKDAYCTMIKNYYSDIMENIAAAAENK